MLKTNTERRNKGQRRWEIDLEFPIRDSGGVLVITDRRTLTDRRLGNTSMEERLVMFSGMMQIETDK